MTDGEARQPYFYLGYVITMRRRPTSTRSTTPAQKARDTRFVYTWEFTTFRGARRLRMATLRRLAQRVWRDARCRGPLPTIVAGRGTPYHGRLYSYCEDGRIVLARNERQVYVLLHELTHAIGYDDHDAAFLRQYQRWLRRYAGWSPTARSSS